MFAGLEFTASTGADYPFNVQKSKYIHFRSISVHGTLNGTPSDDTNGLKIGSSKNVSVTD